MKERASPSKQATARSARWQALVGAFVALGAAATAAYAVVETFWG